jgi:hypothetical protein
VRRDVSIDGRSYRDGVVGCIISWTTASNSAEEDIQVDLVAQPGAARLDGSGSVVPASVEAPIHHTLDAAEPVNLGETGHVGNC